MSKQSQYVTAIVEKQKLVRSKDLKEHSVSRSHLWNLAKVGKIERVGHGLYRAKNAPISAHETLLEVAKRVPAGVLCLSSALRYHELTTESPFEIWLAIERDMWTPKMEFPPLRVVHFSPDTFKFGVETHSEDGGSFRVYSPAKTVADCFKFRSKIGMETAIEALRSAYKEKKASIDEISRAAKVCRVVNVMRPYMESLV